MKIGSFITVLSFLSCLVLLSVVVSAESETTVLLSDDDIDILDDIILRDWNSGIERSKRGLTSPRSCRATCLRQYIRTRLSRVGKPTVRNQFSRFGRFSRLNNYRRILFNRYLSCCRGCPQPTPAPTTAPPTTVATTDPPTTVATTDPPTTGATTDPSTTGGATTDPSTTGGATTDPSTTGGATTDPPTTGGATTDSVGSGVTPVMS